MTRMTRSRRLATAVPLVLLLTMSGLLAGCGGSESGGAASSSGGGGSVAEPAPANGGDTAARVAAGDSGTAGKSAKPGAGTGSAATQLPAGTRRVRTAQATVRVDDVADAAARVRVVAASLGGLVASEQINYGEGPSTMTVRVPEPKLDQALDRFAALGKQVSRSATDDDVTATIADLDSRVATQEASVRRVRALLNNATKLADVVLLEGELTRREADLEAAQARYRALDDQATLATATLTLVPTEPAAAPASDDDGFLAGFAAGWTALKASTAALLTVLGALFPFAIVLGVLGLPVLAWRRRRPAPAAPPVAPPAGPGTPPAQPATPDPDPAPVP